MEFQFNSYTLPLPLPLLTLMSVLVYVSYTKLSVKKTFFFCVVVNVSKIVKILSSLSPCGFLKLKMHQNWLLLSASFSCYFVMLSFLFKEKLFPYSIILRTVRIDGWFTDVAFYNVECLVGIQGALNGVTLNNALDYRTDELYRTPNPNTNPNTSPLVL